MVSVHLHQRGPTISEHFLRPYSMLWNKQLWSLSSGSFIHSCIPATSSAAGDSREMTSPDPSTAIPVLVWAQGTVLFPACLTVS